MRWKPHVRFGGRAEESEQPKGRNRASARSNHTYATLALAAGVPAKVVADRLGHSSVTITLNLYSHVMPAVEGDHADTVARLITAEMPEV